MTADLETLDGLLRGRGGSIAELVADLGLGEDDVLFWSGSWVEGFANDRSDIDLYAIGSIDGDEGAPDVTAPGLPEMRMVLAPGRIRLDVTVVPPELVDGLARYLREFDPQSDYPAAWGDNYREFVHRFKIGVPVVNEPRFRALQESVDFDKFASYLERYYHVRVDSLMEDVLGLRAEGDRLSALLAARLRLETAVDMFLATRGETNTRVDKWRWKKLTRVVGPESRLLEQFLACEGLADGGGDVDARIDACLALTERLVLESV
jgi:hypothetical protein